MLLPFLKTQVNTHVYRQQCWTESHTNVYSFGISWVFVLIFSGLISTYMYMYKCKKNYFYLKAKDLEKILLEIFPSLITDFIKNLPGVSASVPFIAL